MSLSLLRQQCPACLVRLTWIVFVMGRIVGALWGVASRTCSILLKHSCVIAIQLLLQLFS